MRALTAEKNLIFFEDLEKLQDDDDFGIELWKNDLGWPSLKAIARENLLALMDNYAYTLVRNDDRSSSITTIFIPFEFDEGASYVGVELKLKFNKIHNREFLLTEIKRARRTHLETNANGPLFKIPTELEQIEADAAALGILDDYTADDEAAWNSAKDDRDMDNDVYIAELSRSNPAAWAEAAHDAKRF